MDYFPKKCRLLAGLVVRPSDYYYYYYYYYYSKFSNV